MAAKQARICLAVAVCDTLEGRGAISRSIQRPFVASRPSRAYRKKQALCRRPIGADALLKIAN